jgi:hypothetical protein
MRRLASDTLPVIRDFVKSPGEIHDAGIGGWIWEGGVIQQDFPGSR